MRNAVISFPKSGRTWLRLMLDHLGISVDYTHAGADHRLKARLSQLDTRESAAFERMIFLHRDPRDTVVSGYHQATKRLRQPYIGPIGEFIRDDRHGIAKIVHFNSMWFSLARRDSRICLVSYEDLRAEPGKWLSLISAHFDCPRSAASIQAAIAENTFSKMQEREVSGALFATYGDIFSPGAPADPDALKVRRGKISGYLDELSGEDISYCDAILARRSAD